MNSRPDDRQAAGRLLALTYVVAHAWATAPCGALEEWFGHSVELDQWGFTEKIRTRSGADTDAVYLSPILASLSPWEQRFANLTARETPKQDWIDAMWLIEAAQVLMWALQIVTDLPGPGTQASSNILRVGALSRPTELLASPALRPEWEIENAREIAELWNWRSRTEQLIRNGEPFPHDENWRNQGIESYRDIVRLAANAAHERNAIQSVIAADFGVKGKPYCQLTLEEWSEVRSISQERHRALNWLCGYSENNDWDSTPTET